MKKVIYAAMLLLGLSIVGCQKEPEPVKVAGVVLDSTSLSLSEGETATLSATVTPSDAENKNVHWSTSSLDVATVSNGIVTAVKEGKATITVTTDDGGKTAECVVTVKAKSSYIDEYGIDHGAGITIDGITWAPVNCGYKSASENSAGYEWGKLYQWGRKYGQGYGTPYSSETSGDTNFADETVPTIADTWSGLNENTDPNTHYHGDLSHNDYDWITTPDNSFWNSGTESNPIKTKYDPCPSGWRVPTATELRTIAEGHNSGMVTYKGKKGIWFSGSVKYSENVENKIFLPCAGERFWDNWFHHSGCCRRESAGRYSSSTAVHPENATTNFYLLWFDASAQRLGHDGVKAAGKSIRCVKE